MLFSLTPKFSSGIAIVSIAVSILVSADEELDVEDTEIIEPGVEAYLMLELENLVLHIISRYFNNISFTMS